MKFDFLFESYMSLLLLDFSQAFLLDSVLAYFHFLWAVEDADDHANARAVFSSFLLEDKLIVKKIN